MGLFDGFKKALRDTTPTPAKIEAAIEANHRLETEIRQEIVDLEARRATSILEDDTVRSKLKAQLADARDRLDETLLFRKPLEEAHATAVAAEENTRRRAVYAEAKAKADAAAKMLASAYPKLVKDALGLLKALAEAQLAVRDANGALPGGAAPILDPELAARGVAGLSPEVLSDQELELWCRVGELRPLDDAFQSEIYEVGDGWGKRPDDIEPVYRKVRFRRVEYREFTTGAQPLPLSAMLRLPALKGEGVAWGYFSAFSYEPALDATLNGSSDPEAVLARVAEVDLTPAAPATDARRSKVEWEMLGDVHPLKPVSNAGAYHDGTARRSPARAVRR